MADSDTYEFRQYKGLAFKIPRPFNRTGYQFKHWTLTSQDSEESYGEREEVEFSEDTDLYAQWTANTYKVRFNANSGTGTMNDQPFTYDEGKTLTSNAFTRPGYSYRGWARTSEATQAEYSNGQQVRNLTSTNNGIIDLYAIWEINTYTVTFDPNGGTWASGGSADKQITQNYGTPLEAPSLSRTGHTFSRWEPPVPNTMPAENKTFRAQWQINQYTATFDYNGGKDETNRSGTTKTQNYGADLIAPTVTRDGYAFSSWTPSVPTTMPAENCTYTAQWRQICTVTFNVVNNKATAVPPRQVLSGQSVGELPSTSLPQPQGDLAGMNFAGWWTSEDGGEEVTSSTIVSSNVTYYAHWEGVIYYQKVSRNTSDTVSIDSNGVASGFYGSKPDNVQRALESIPATKFDFSGAFTIVMKCQVTYNRPSGEEGGRWDVFGGHSVDGCYNHLCDFGIYGGSINGDKSSQWEIASDYNRNLPSGVACSTGTGWNTSVDQTKPIYLKVVRDFYNEKWRIRCYLSTDGIYWNQETVNNNAMQPLGIGQFCIGTDPDSLSEYFPGKIFLNDCYLLQENSNSTQPKGKYILRKKNSETTTVTLDPQDGHDGDTSVLAIRGQAMPQITIPTNEGHTFTGYYEQIGGLGAKYYNPDGGSNRNWDKSVNTATLYAHWTANQYTATFNANGGTGGKTVTQDYGTALSAPTVTRTGHTFNGWNPSVPSTMPVNGGTYVAQWTANTYQVTFNKQNGTGGSNIVTATYGSAMPQATMPTRTGYVFGGYYDGENGAGIQYYNSDGTSARTWDKTKNTTLYAKWSEDNITITYHRNFNEQI